MIRQAKNIIKSAVGWLHHDFNRTLGISNTFYLCKAINTLLLGRRWHRYKEAYLDGFHGLVQENGEINGWPRNVMRDGWAIDRSGTLPFVQELLNQTRPILQERGGVKQEEGDTTKLFFRSIYQDGDLEDCPAILNFVLSSEVLATVAHQIGCVPVLSRLSPPGVRMMESNEAYNPNPPDTFAESQFFHLDLHDRPVIYVLVLLDDTTDESGPWRFLPASSSTRARRLLRYQNRGEPYRVTDERMYSAVDPSEVISFTGKAGDVLFIESSSCFHYGSRKAVKPRFQMMYAFTTPCRGDLKEWILYGMRPEVKPTDSTLRRLVLRA